MSTLSELQASMADWHGLDPSKFGDLKLAGRFATTKDASSWQENAECYLFEKVMIITVEKEPYKRSLKGSVLLKHLKDVKSLADQAGQTLELRLAVEQLPVLKLRSSDQSQVDAWKTELNDMAGSGSPM